MLKFLGYYMAIVLFVAMLLLTKGVQCSKSYTVVDYIYPARIVACELKDTKPEELIKKGSEKFKSYLSYLIDEVSGWVK